MSSENPENHHHLKHEELPDYSEEAIPSASDTPWFKDPVKRKWILRLVLALLVGIAFIPLYRAVKDWRASSLMTKSGEAFALGDSRKGLSLLKQALALSPGSVGIQHAVELYNARVGDTASFEKLVAGMKSGSLDDRELLGIAEIAVMKGRVEETREALGLLSEKSGKRHFLRRSLLEATLSSLAENPAAAAEFCIQRSKEAPSRGDSGYLRIQAALNLLSVRDSPDVSRALELLNGVITDRSPASVAAWRIKAGLLLSPPPGISIADSDSEAGRLSALLPSLSDRHSGDELLAADLAIKSAPETKAEVVSRLIKSRRLASRADALDLARWLNGHECHKEVIAMCGDRAANDTDWLLVALDAKCSLGEMNEIPGMLATPAGAGIQEAVRHLYLARIAMMKGDEVSADLEWRNVGASLHLEKSETLAYIAGYEERIGALERAAKTYRELANRQETRVNGLIGVIRCQPGDTSAKKLIPLYLELVAVLPENQDFACDLAYLRLLAKEDVPDASAAAEKLLLLQPNALTRISTAALGRLRSGNAKGALDLYQGKEIDWNQAAMPWRVVRCAVLQANGLGDEVLRNSITPESLRPEERTLMIPDAGMNASAKK